MEKDTLIEKKKLKLIEFLPMIISWISIVCQIVLTFVKWNNYYDLDYLGYIGYGFWALGAIFGILPIIIFRLKGGVKKKDSYIKTTAIVTSGLYSIVRHPQYLAGIYISIALAFMSQFWVIILLVLPVIVCTYIDTLTADKKLIEKFGEEYSQYKKQVPALTPMFGLVKLIIRKAKQKT
ncbi:MAG: isoprenylcysteine carboxylmethyltransferase family protein [Asgard group archaeon]|nr:isoprenylcysteine carboxylmethyltransferase family protein [Asgard group archaeon]